MWSSSCEVALFHKKVQRSTCGNFLKVRYKPYVTLKNSWLWFPKCSKYMLSKPHHSFPDTLYYRCEAVLFHKKVQRSTCGNFLKVRYKPYVTLKNSWLWFPKCSKYMLSKPHHYFSDTLYYSCDAIVVKQCYFIKRSQNSGGTPSSALKRVATCSPETSVPVNRTK